MIKRIFTILLLGISMSASAAEILVWDHDAGARVYSPIMKRQVGCEYGMSQALKQMGHNVTLVRRLPEDLSGYDAVFVFLGFLTPS